MSESVSSPGMSSTTDTDHLWTDLLGQRASDEDAALTPIFHALARGEWRSRHEEPARARGAGESRGPAVQAAPPREGAEEPEPPADEFESFRRDPLRAPLPPAPIIPITPIATSAPEGPAGGGRRRAGAHAVPEVRRGGRHHRRFVPLDGGATD